MNKTYEEVVDDCIPLYGGDRTLMNLYGTLWKECREKGLIYHELAKSKFLNGQLKYIITWWTDGHVSILDLDTNEEVSKQREAIV